LCVAGRCQVKSKARGPDRPKDYIRGNFGYNAANPTETPEMTLLGGLARLSRPG
jgi:hypothetical protein